MSARTGMVSNVIIAHIFDRNHYYSSMSEKPGRRAIIPHRTATGVIVTGISKNNQLFLLHTSLFRVVNYNHIKKNINELFRDFFVVFN